MRHNLSIFLSPKFPTDSNEFKIVMKKMQKNVHNKYLAPKQLCSMRDYHSLLLMTNDFWWLTAVELNLILDNQNMFFHSTKVNLFQNSKMPVFVYCILTEEINTICFMSMMQFWWYLSTATFFVCQNRQQREFWIILVIQSMCKESLCARVKGFVDKDIIT